MYRSFKLGGGIANDCAAEVRDMRDAIPYARRLSVTLYTLHDYFHHSLHTCSYSEDLLV